MAFEENNPGIWEYSKDGDMIEGVLLKIQDKVGPSDSMLYSLSVKEKPVNVWGSTILDQRMVGINVGDVIQIIYKGLAEAKPGKNPAKLFQVLIDKEKSK